MRPTQVLEILTVILLCASLALLIFGALRRAWWLLAIGSLALVLTFLLAYILFFTPFQLQTERYTYSFFSGQNSLRVAFFSDLHIGVNKGRAWVKKVVQEVNSETPDLILIGGDFVYRANSEDLLKILEPLAELKAPLGVYAVLGNHDYGVPGEDLSSELEKVLLKYDVSVLKNENIDLGSFVLVGVDEVWAERADLPKAFPDQASKPILALVHNPDLFLLPEKSIPQANLWLMGHTHNGQVRLPFFGAPFSSTDTSYQYGRYFSPWGTIIISQGCGETGPRLRLMTRPEIVILDLR